VKRIVAMITVVVAMGAVGLAVGLVAFGGEDQAQARGHHQRQHGGAGHAAGGCAGTMGTHTAITGDYTLSAVDKEAIAYMLEEEKLAHDAYVVLADKYGLRVFSNIQTSESRHVAAVESLVTAYGLADPTSGSGAGTFDNHDLQALYDKLIASGTSSVAKAIQAGITIEKTDIGDLRTRIGRTGNPEVKAVFSNLLRASYKHLAAFQRQLAVYGG
jgi:hypothetical protein